MFAKTLDTPKNPSSYFIVIPFKRSFYERLCSASTFLFPGLSRLHGLLPSCCSDPLIWVPIYFGHLCSLGPQTQLLSLLADLVVQQVPYASLSLSDELLDETMTQILVSFPVLPTLSPHLPYCCSNHNIISFLSIEMRLLFNFSNLVWVLYRQSHKTTQMDKNPNFAVFVWWVLLAFQQEKPGVNGNQGQKVKRAPSPHWGADKNVNRCN